MQILGIGLVKLSLAVAATFAVVGTQLSCGASTMQGSTTISNSGGDDGEVTCGTISVDTSLGNLHSSNAGADAGSCTPPGGGGVQDCWVVDMWVGTFIDAGDPPNGVLDCTELRNPQHQQGGPGHRKLYQDSYSAAIPPTGGSNPGPGAMVVCATVQCPGEAEPRKMNSVAWSGSVKVPPGKDICSCFTDAVAQGGTSSPASAGSPSPGPRPVPIDGDWLNDPSGSTYDRGASFHVRSNSGTLVQSCTVRTEPSYQTMEISSHPSSTAMFAKLDVYSGGTLVLTDSILLSGGGTTRPTGVWTASSTFEGYEIIVTLYDANLAELGEYKVSVL